MFYRVPVMTCRLLTRYNFPAVTGRLLTRCGIPATACRLLTRYRFPAVAGRILARYGIPVMARRLLTRYRFPTMLCRFPGCQHLRICARFSMMLCRLLPVLEFSVAQASAARAVVVVRPYGKRQQSGYPDNKKNEHNS